ncbi:hypothetical protein GCM10008959_29030 [Deinococcus seoulensis]|uniref:eCIS core domain-containing protein n=1 Tax=Deinococcus seoulensis TaxID=1837379 RepID=A0ABQ2RXX2_9DEIO|nr:DUF4157 domain-containing protein [Deinococcus seoulensis]GGR65050.1 hypothetical protein GCM10008959_29030 [Deinococcus seoulensis]
MEYQRKPQRPAPATRQVSTHTPDPPALTQLEAQRHTLQRFTARPQTAQRQAAAPVLRAATLQRQEEGRLASDRATIQRQVTALGNVAPVQPQTQSPVPVKPVTPADWITVMRSRAEGVEGQRLDTRAFGEFQTLQRQVAQTLAHSFRSDRGDPQARYATYGEHLATLQRHALSAPVSRVVLGMVPPAERLPLQRAADEALQRQRAQEQAVLNFGSLQTLQRQLAELDAEATQPILQRIQARRGAGNPLPEAIQRHLEGGLNHDLSRVRIHDDAEADKLAKGVNAVAFTTGTDIFFQAGRFNPNTQSGLELLAHEVTHTVQQSQGRVGTGIDPDAGLEQEARATGKRLVSKAVGGEHGAYRLLPLPAAPTRVTWQRAAGMVVVPIWKKIKLIYPIQKQLVASKGFKELSDREKEIILFYIGGSDYYISSLARGILEADVSVGNIDLNKPEAIRRFMNEQEARMRIIDPLPGTFDKNRSKYIIEKPIYVKGHHFDSSVANARKYIVKIGKISVSVFVPVLENKTSDKIHSIEEIAKGLAALPLASLKLVKIVNVNPQANPGDAYWAKEYNRPGFRAYMTAGADGIVGVYPTREKQTQQFLDGSLIHEAGHILSESTFKEKDWEKWKTAQDKDKIFPSDYAKNAPREDFSESLNLYYTVKGKPEEEEVRRIFRYRFLIIDGLLKR